MRIVLIVEGETEVVFKQALINILSPQCAGSMPNLDFAPCHGYLLSEGHLRKLVEKHLGGASPADAVIALTDVYRGSPQQSFRDAKDAKRRMQEWVGNEPRFHPHAAQYEFEAWLLPFWEHLYRLATKKPPKRSPWPRPEVVNHDRPPSKLLAALFTGSRSYSKRRDALAALDWARKEGRLTEAVDACLELKALVNTILELCGKSKIS